MWRQCALVSPWLQLNFWVRNATTARVLGLRKVRIMGEDDYDNATNFVRDHCAHGIELAACGQQAILAAFEVAAGVEMNSAVPAFKLEKMSLRRELALQHGVEDDTHEDCEAFDGPPSNIWYFTLPPLREWRRWDDLIINEDHKLWVSRTTSHLALAKAISARTKILEPNEAMSVEIVLSGGAKARKYRVKRLADSLALAHAFQVKPKKKSLPLREFRCISNIVKKEKIWILRLLLMGLGSPTYSL